LKNYSIVGCWVSGLELPDCSSKDEKDEAKLTILKSSHFVWESLVKFSFENSLDFKSSDEDGFSFLLVAFYKHSSTPVFLEFRA